MSRYLGLPNRSLFIKHIPFDTRSEDLRFVFSEFGRVKDVYIPRDYYSRRIRGFAYVEFERLRDAEYAVRNVDHIRLFGQELRVEFAQGDRKTPSEMRVRYSSRHNHRSSRQYDRRRSYYRTSRSRSRSRSPTTQEKRRCSPPSPAPRSRSRSPMDHYYNRQRLSPKSSATNQNANDYYHQRGGGSGGGHLYPDNYMIRFSDLHHNNNNPNNSDHHSHHKHDVQDSGDEYIHSTRKH